MEPITYNFDDQGAGTVLLKRAEDPIPEGAIRTFDIETKHVNNVVIDIKASHTCTLEICRLPAFDGSDGESSGIVNIPANAPQSFSYSSVQCRGLRCRVMNSSGQDMTFFWMYVRGGK